MKLVTLTNKELQQDLRDKDIRFLYPLKSFSVGYPQTYEIEEIDDFLLINRLLTDEELDTLEKLLKKSHIKGIVFDDLGVLEVIKDLDIEKVLLLDHYATNVRSINYYLDYCDSVVVSSDLNIDEIEYISKNAKKEVIVMVFGLKRLMYSRRYLLTNYALHHKIELKTKIKSVINDKGFLILEDDYGTCFYAGKYYNALELLSLKNIKYFWYDCIDLDDEEIKRIIKDKAPTIGTETLFLHEVATYKIKGGEK